MQLGLIVETNDPERIWNGFRLANTALDSGDSVEVFLLGDGVEAPDLDPEKFNPSGIMRKYLNEGGTLYACGSCLDSRHLDEDDLRPRSTMDDCHEMIEAADKVFTIG